MDLHTLWSLRLGFNNKQGEIVKQKGISKFLNNSFALKPDTILPSFLANEPKTPLEVKELREKYRTDEEGKKLLRRQEIKISYELRAWWIEKMINDPYPLREKMTLFWHNHYVSTAQKVKVNYWIYSHNMVLRENAFGNFRELTKKVLRTNAMVRYLDNDRNVKGKFNENLSRELLELFTLGVGNYTEQDIKNGAKGLAGLSIGKEGALYRPKLENQDEFIYFNETGNFKIDEMVDIIFSQKNAPYFITRKLLKWFIYDNPPEELVKYYGNYLREQDYEIQPLLLKMFNEEFDKPTAGSKIKDPLLYILQLIDELQITQQNNKLIAFFATSQGMNLFNQPNVKGWDGGNSWLTAQLLLQRNNIADLLCKGKNFNRSQLKAIKAEEDMHPDQLITNISWDRKGNNKDVITQLKNRLLYNTDETLQKDFEAILKYDFDPNSPGADNGVIRLFNYIIKTPEFQLI